MSDQRQEAYCTLLMSDDYLPGAMVLGHSLRDNGTNKQLAALVTLDSLQASTISELEKVYDQIISVDRIVNKTPANLFLMHRPDLISTFTKIALWRQTQFSRLVYIDADVVALRAPDELFNDKSDFAAVPDIGWPDCFNSGVLALKPNTGDYYALLALAQRGISFDGADQGLLNMHFRDWHRLSFTYNCTPSGNYQYVPAYRHFQSTINMVHYIGDNKPWVVGRESKGATGVYEELLGRWWAIYDKHYRYPACHPQLYVTGVSADSKEPQAYSSEQSEQEARNVREYVKGETSYPVGLSAGSSVGHEERTEASITTTEPQLTEKTELAKDLVHGDANPLSTAQQRRFSVAWDPIQSVIYDWIVDQADLSSSNPPPSQSRPEAANFPNQTYEMSADPQLFHAPEKYPEPPKNMYYQVPEGQPASQRPKPIFPWETNQLKPTRVFADDPPTPSETAPSVTTDDDTQTETVSPSTPTISVTSQELLPGFSRSNAWDDMPEIDRYIANLPQNRLAKTQVLLNNTQGTSDSGGQSITSPASEAPPQHDRPGSIKITDFPTEIERPSLPVTPAPVRRPSFWGEERDAAGELPAAKGVPEQSQWDPSERLVALQRRQSQVLEMGPQSPSKAIPDRRMLGSATFVAEEAAPESTQGAPATAEEPTAEFAGDNTPVPADTRTDGEEGAAALPTAPVPIPPSSAQDLASRAPIPAATAT